MSAFDPMRETVTVLGEDATTTAYTRAVATVRGLLTHADARGAASSPDRAAMLAERVLLFDPAYVMPADSQLRVSGHAGLWAVADETLALRRGDGLVPPHRRCIVRRQD